MNNFTFRTASEALPVLMKAVLEEGDEVGSRNGRTMELSPVHIELTEPWKREILVPGRKASLPAQIAESMWVLSGRDDIEWLSHYLPRASEFSDDGKTWRGAYGPRLRRWGGDDGSEAFRDPIDQLAEVINLLKKDPLSRRAVISIFDPEVDHEPSKDIPCNNWLHFMSRLGKLDLHVTIRSNDLMWGWSGINAFEWSVLQEIVAKALGIQVGSLHFQISSLHLYEQHWNKAAKIAEAQPLEHTISQKFNASLSIEDLDHLFERWFRAEEQIRTEHPSAHLIHSFPEPMLQEWLFVLAWHSTQDKSWLSYVTNDLRAAANFSPDVGPIVLTREELLSEVKQPSEFVTYVSELHAEKHKAYGDSWKKRGEMLGIMANIARKVDRLGVSDDHETAADTAIDLLAYLCKYRWWLSTEANAPLPCKDHIGSEVQLVDFLLRDLSVIKPPRRGDTEEALRQNFDLLEQQVAQKNSDRWITVNNMILFAYALANRLWQKDKNATQRFEGYNDPRPHSRACGPSRHNHGGDCHSNCPTCGGKEES